MNSNIKMYGKFLKQTTDDTQVLTVVPVVTWVEHYGNIVPLFYLPDTQSLMFAESFYLEESLGEFDGLFSECNYEAQKKMLTEWMQEYIIGQYRYINWL